MKKVLLLGLVVGLVGCKETNTGLDKELLNTGYDKCKEYLRASLKSPSSLKIDQATISTFIATPDNVYRVYKHILFDDGQLKKSHIEEKIRFREFLVDIDYDANNSYGAALRGSYQCEFIYMLKNDQMSPQALDTYMMTNIESEENEGVSVDIPLAELKGSNFFLDGKIQSIIGVKENAFSELDKKMYLNLSEKQKFNEMYSDAEKLRKSWDQMSDY